VLGEFMVADFQLQDLDIDQRGISRHNEIY